MTRTQSYAEKDQPMTTEPDLFARLRRLAAKADAIGGETQRQVVAILATALLSEADKATMRADLEAVTPDPDDDRRQRRQR